MIWPWQRKKVDATFKEAVEIERAKFSESAEPYDHFQKELATKLRATWMFALRRLPVPKDLDTRVKEALRE